jgi:NitT/TauT family transport system substrate-binding protein
MLEGASYLGLTAILNAADLSEEDIDLQVTGFTQVETLATDQVEAVVVYTANEPTQLRERGEAITVLPAADYTNLLSNGLIVHEEQVTAHPQRVERFVSAFNQALRFTLENPDTAFEHSTAYVEGLDDPDVAPIARQVLQNSLPLWRGDSGTLGRTQPADWQATQEVLLQVGLLEEPLDLDAAYTNAFTPQ